MALSITKRPHTWNDAWNPIIVEAGSTRHPANADNTVYSISSVSNDNAYARFTLSSNTELYEGAWVRIRSTEYNGIVQIKKLAGSNATVNMPYSSTVVHSGTLQFYPQNFKAILSLYAETSGGKLEKLIELEQKSNPDGKFRFDLAPYLRSLLQRPALAGDNPLLNTQCYKRFAYSICETFLHWGSLYSTPDLVTVRINEISDVADSCTPGQMLDDTEMLISMTDVDAVWKQDDAESGAGWVSNINLEEDIIKVVPNDYYTKTLYQEVSGLSAGGLFHFYFEMHPSECKVTGTIQLVLLSANKETVVKEIPVIGDDLMGNHNTIAFVVPDDGESYTAIGIRLLFDNSGCVEPFVLDRAELFDMNSCVRRFYAHYSAYQYTEQPGESDKLAQHVTATSSTRFLTTYPRENPKVVLPDDNEWLGILFDFDSVTPQLSVEYQYSGGSSETRNLTFTGQAGRFDIQTGLGALATAGIGPTGGTPLKYDIALRTDAGAYLTERFAYKVPACHTAYYRRLHWLNSRGSWDSYGFSGKGEHTIEVSRQGSYKRNVMPYDFEAPYRQYGSLITNGRRLLNLDSGLCPRPVTEWLWQAVLSPEVYLQWDEGGITQYLPVEADGNSFKMYSDGDRLYSVSFKIRYAFDLIGVEG